EQGYIQEEIRHSAYKTQQKIESGEETIVGLNKFQIDEETQPELLRVDPKLGDQQREKLSRLKEERDGEQVKQALARLREGAEGSQNLMPLILNAVKAYATVGEICH